MQERDKENFSKMLLGLGELFDKEISEILLSIYWEALKPYPWTVVKEALNKAAVMCRFFPKPVEIIELIEGSDTEQAEEAWATLLDAIEQCGAYVSVVFADGRIARCIELMGGWEAVNRWKIDELPFRRKDFLAIYKSLPKTGPAKVVGIIEKENLVRGYLEDPKFASSKAIAPLVTMPQKQGNMEKAKKEITDTNYRVFEIERIGEEENAQC